MTTKLKLSERSDMELRRGPTGVRRYHLKTPPPPSFWARVGCWLKDAEAHRRRYRAARAWYRSVGVAPEPPSASKPKNRDEAEQRRIRAGYRAWLTERGFDPDTGYNSLGVDAWGGIKGQQLSRPVNLLTGKPWAPTGFLRDGTHARTGTPYGPDGADADGWLRPDAEGRRVNVLTGTIFSPGSPPRTFNGETPEQYWHSHRGWRTPEVEAQIQRDRLEAEEASARIAAELAEEARIERRVRDAQRRDSKGRYTA